MQNETSVDSGDTLCFSVVVKRWSETATVWTEWWNILKLCLSGAIYHSALPHQLIGQCCRESSEFKENTHRSSTSAHRFCSCIFFFFFLLFDFIQGKIDTKQRLHVFPISCTILHINTLLPTWVCWGGKACSWAALLVACSLCCLPACSFSVPSPAPWSDAAPGRQSEKVHGQKASHTEEDVVFYL